jgi:uncharacterized protein DUF4197
VPFLLYFSWQPTCQPNSIACSRGLSQESGGADLSDAKIASGLREALRVGTQNAVNLTGKTDGYFLNQVIKILMPEKLRTLEQGCARSATARKWRRVGAGHEPGCRAVGACRQGDLRKRDRGDELRGRPQDSEGPPETAATDYFKSKTTDQLTTAFRPTVERSMSKVGVTRQYQELLGLAKAIPFLKAQGARRSLLRRRR